MSVQPMPKHFIPTLGNPTDVRIAEALEFIAARMSIIEYDTSEMRRLMIMLQKTLAATAFRPQRPGDP